MVKRKEQLLLGAASEEQGVPAGVLAEEFGNLCDVPAPLAVLSAIETEQVDDIQCLLETKGPRNSRPYLALATRVHERFRDRE